MTKIAIVQTTLDFAMREINALDVRIAAAEDDVDAMLWEQARQVVEQLHAGQSQRAVAGQWINARTGEPYSHVHVGYTARAFGKSTYQPRPRFRDVYNSVANASRTELVIHADAPPMRPPVPDITDEPEGVFTDAPVGVADTGRSAMAVHHSSKSVEHYTPRVVLDAVVQCLGAIDLDPCSDQGDPPNVPARRHYTAEDDGLSKPWRGRVFMNPPYGIEIDAWVTKLCAEVISGRVPHAIALVPARPGSEWWSRLRDAACCFINGRLTFVGNDDPAPFPSAVFYLGADLGKFYTHFAALGDIWQRVEPGLFGE